MRKVKVLSCIATAIAMASLSTSTLADGGRIVDSCEIGGLRATVMASPWPLQAGPAELGVFLQTADGEAVLDATVTVGWTALSPGEEWIPPCCRMKGPEGMVAASRTHGQNRLVYSANLTIPGSGPGNLQIAIDHDGAKESIAMTMVAEPPAPPALAYLPWLAMTPLAIAAFAFHQQIKRRPRR
ncbi:MAG: hypothetical protein Fur0032_09170 [Terrimicrobiaceae bacterium]